MLKNHKGEPDFKVGCQDYLYLNEKIIKLCRVKSVRHSLIQTFDKDGGN
jgi:hypothetical protein